MVFPNHTLLAGTKTTRKPAPSLKIHNCMPLLAFAVTLFAAVLISCKTRQSVLSVSVLFVASGLLVGKGVLDLPMPNRELLSNLSEMALFSVLFTDVTSSRLAAICLPDSEGNQEALGSIWGKAPAIVAFLRHYG